MKPLNLTLLDKLTSSGAGINVISYKMIMLPFFSELRWGKAMVAYTSPNRGRRKKEESERLRGERDEIKFIYLQIERWQVVRFRKAKKKAICSINCVF